MRVDIAPPQRLGHLPLVMDVFRRSGMAEIIDHVVGQDPRSVVSTSECVALILAGAYTGSHSLWRLRERLAHYDMHTVMQDATFDLERFPEERLAKALDDLHAAGPERIMTDIAVRMIEAYRLKTDFVHFDTTTLSFYGAYEPHDGLPDSSGFPQEWPRAPRVTFGHSKKHRPDLKQILYGMMVTSDGGIPLMGKAMDGNMSDIIAASDFFARVRHFVRDPREVCCVADSKGWCARVLDIADEHGLRVLSRLPRTHALHQELLDRPSGSHTQRLEVSKGKQTDCYTYEGWDVEETLTYTALDDQGATVKHTITVPARAVRVHSTALLRSKMATRARLAEREAKRAAALFRDWHHEAFACASDAQRAAQRRIDANAWATLDLCAEVTHHDGPAKRGRGRPRKKPEPALATSEHWRVRYTTKPVSEHETARRLHDQATFILIRTRQDRWKIPDADMIRIYKEQYRVEHGFAWLKSGMPIEPIYLHTEERINGLCFVYCLGLMIWNLIQRTVRNYLVEHNTGLPYHRRKLSANITTRFLFELFPAVSTVAVTIDGNTEKRLAGMEQWQRLACKALGTRISQFETPP